MTNKIESFILYGREFQSINVCETCNKTGPTTINKKYCIGCLKAHKKTLKRKKLDKLKANPESYKEFCDKINKQQRKDYQKILNDPDRCKKLKARKKRNRIVELKNRRKPEAWSKRLKNDRINYKKRVEKLKKDPEAYEEYRKNKAKTWRDNRRKARLQHNNQTLMNLKQKLKDDDETN